MQDASEKNPEGAGGEGAQLKVMPLVPSFRNRDSSPRREPAPKAIRLGIRRRFLRDGYHYLLDGSWPKVLGLLLLCYLLVNAVFALLYVATGNGITNAQPGSFKDAFFFSVQTMATIGYGRMAPETLAADILVTIEVLAGLLAFSVATGLMFAKFSRPTARVMFSRFALVTMYEGVPSLVFRMANERANQIAVARLSLILLRNEITAEGETIRRMRDLPLVRDESPAFALTWTAVHPITRHSPLYGETAASLKRQAATIVASLTGLDETFAQTIYARHAYEVEHIVWGARFVDIISRSPDSPPVIDYSRFHDFYFPEPLPGSPANSPEERAPRNAAGR